MSTQPFRLKVASPCRVSWAQMSGDDRVRACSQCNKNVYNLSTMTRDEAVGLVRAREGQICARFFQRADGTVMTSDCGPGVRRARFAMAAAISLIALIFGVPVFFSRRADGDSRLSATFDDLVTEMRRVPVIGPVVSYFSPEPVVMMGDVAGP